MGRERKDTDKEEEEISKISKIISNPHSSAKYYPYFKIKEIRRRKVTVKAKCLGNNSDKLLTVRKTGFDCLSSVPGTILSV